MAANGIKQHGHANNLRRHPQYNFRFENRTTIPSEHAEGLAYYDSNAGNKHLYYCVDDTVPVYARVLRGDTAETITGLWTFHPDSAGSQPFAVHTNGTGRVDNLNADRVDSFHASQSVVANTLATRNGDGTLSGADPTSNEHFVTLGYVTNLIDNYDPKDPCEAATTGNIDVSSAPATFDGYAASNGDRIFVWQQVAGEENGIRIFQGVGNPMPRASDADEDNEVTSGMQTFIRGGNTHTGAIFMLKTADPIVLDTDALEFVQVGGNTLYSDGRGLTKSGNTFHAIQSTAYSVGDIVFADGAATLAFLTAVETGSVLKSGGLMTAPLWGKVDLTTDITGTLPVGKGGTGTDSQFASGSVVFAAGSGRYAENNTKFFWDNTNFRLALGSGSASHTLDVSGTGRVTGKFSVGNSSRTAMLDVRADAGEAFRVDVAGAAYRLVVDQGGVNFQGIVNLATFADPNNSHSVVVEDGLGNLGRRTINAGVWGGQTANRVLVTSGDGDITTDVDLQWLNAGQVYHGNNSNSAGHNFVVNTTNKDAALFAYGVQRAGVDVGGVRIDGRIQAINGSSEYPGFTFQGDANTGFYNSSADSIGVVLGGASYVSFTTTTAIFNSAIKVGIGTSLLYNPLTVNGAIQAGANTSTVGSRLLVAKHDGVNGDYIPVLSTEYSSGAFVIGYGAEGKNGAAGFVSTYDSAPLRRSALVVSGGTLQFVHTGSAVSTLLGSDLTMTTVFETTTDGDLVMRGGRVVVRESDDGNDAAILTRDVDEGYLILNSSGTKNVELRGGGDSFFQGGRLGVGGAPTTDLDVISDSANPIRLYRNGVNASLQTQNSVTSVYFGVNASGNACIGHALDQTVAYFQLSSEGKLTLSTPSTGETLEVNMLDNTASAVLFQQGGNQYLGIDTTNGGELITYGNTTVKPDHVFLGGNIAVGTSDIENWVSSYLAIQFPFSAIMAGAASKDIWFTSNYYFDGADRYRSAGTAAIYAISSSGSHLFRVAPSGAADAEISWTNALTINNDGTLTAHVLGTGSGHSVLTEESGVIKKRTIDSRAWSGGGLVDGSGSANALAVWNDGNTLTYRATAQINGSSQLLGCFGAATTSGNLDWNDSSNARPGNGYSLLQGTATNGPSANHASATHYFHSFSYEYNTKDATGNMTQFAIPYNGVHMLFRYRYSGFWSGWYNLWNSGNDGAGSGMDSDKLDGQEGAYYTTASNIGGLSGGRFVVTDASGKLATSSLTHHDPGSSRVAFNRSAGIHNDSVVAIRIKDLAVASNVTSAEWALFIEGQYGYDIDAGVTESGNRSSLVIYGHVVDSDFEGTLNTQQGIYLTHGHEQSAVGSVINTSYGLRIVEVTSGSTTVGASWGIHQSGAYAQNYFGGKTGIGVAPGGQSLTVSGSVELDGSNTYIVGGDGEILVGQDSGGYYLFAGYSSGVAKAIKIGDDATEVRFKTAGSERLYVNHLGTKFTTLNSGSTSTVLIDGGSGLVQKRDIYYGVWTGLAESFAMNNTPGVVGGTDLNGLNNGVYANYGATNYWVNTPNSSYGIVWTQKYPSADNAFQLYWDIRHGNTNYGDLYLRTKNTSGWATWRKLWHSGNHGPNSGMNADLLDGQHGSYYTTASNIGGLGNSRVVVTDGTGKLTSDSALLWDGNGMAIGTSVSALLTLGAGGTTKAPLKFGAGPLLTTPQVGAMEFSNETEPALYFTRKSGARKRICLVHEEDIGDGTNSTFTIVHDLGAKPVSVVATFNSSGEEFVPDWDIVDDNTISVTYLEVLAEDEVSIRVAA